MEIFLLIKQMKLFKIIIILFCPNLPLSIQEEDTPHFLKSSTAILNPKIWTLLKKKIIACTLITHLHLTNSLFLVLIPFYPIQELPEKKSLNLKSKQIHLSLNKFNKIILKHPFLLFNRTEADKNLF
jgi:hypothetical protein